MLAIPSDRPLPHSPGVYQFKDSAGHIIYIGKAKDLKKRVSSYFAAGRQAGHNAKTAALVKHISSIDFILTDSEEEAILLESNLIKQHYPKYNIDLKDNSPISYALVTDEPAPRLLLVRKDRHGRIRGPKGRAYGPFMAGSGRAAVAIALRKAFKIRTCGNPLPKRICLQFHLGNCDGPCERRISLEDYRAQVGEMEKLLAHPDRIEQYSEVLSNKMREASLSQNFELAIQYRNAWQSLSGLSGGQKLDRLADKDEDYAVLMADKGHARAQVWRLVHGVLRERVKFEFDYVEQEPMGAFLQRYYEGHPIPRTIYVSPKPADYSALERHLARLRGASVSILTSPSRGPAAELMRLIGRNIMAEEARGADPALVSLQKELKLERLPLVIECFDVSNLMGTHVVASMVQLADARPKKSEYRKFRIRTVEGQDDFASIKEAVFRRYRRLRDEGAPMPDLVLIDGGLGQLHAAKEALDELGVSLPLFSLAKENEEIYGLDMLHPLRLERRSEALHVLQRARDEAHRFVISYNRKLRRKAATAE
ncbi:MAG: excinuclease ABC subunit UvrC [Candidatus Marsarchaeota archaeon]|nr:excinuclease ABC subunit UvrC [Candidatus Marsarchaeota archaeon]